MKIVCLGDSLTTGYNLAPGEGWVDLLNRETPHLWVNAGVAGDTSTGLLVRLQSQALPQKPDMILFMGGDNDIMLTGSADQAKSAVMAMVHQCVAAGVRPVVGIPYPVRTIPAQWQPVCDTSVTVPQARLIVIQPWDKSLLKEIEKAILQSDLGLTPMNDGNLIRLAIPQLTEERRKELSKVVSKKSEEGKIAIRNIRRDGMDFMKKEAKKSDVSEDIISAVEDKIQKLTDKKIKEVEDVTDKKIKEIMSV